MSMDIKFKFKDLVTISHGFYPEGYNQGEIQDYRAGYVDPDLGYLYEFLVRLTDGTERWFSQADLTQRTITVFIPLSNNSGGGIPLETSNVPLSAHSYVQNALNRS